MKLEDVLSRMSGVLVFDEVTPFPTKNVMLSIMKMRKKYLKKHKTDSITIYTEYKHNERFIMTNESKYYTPLIEEFHVGFECEIYSFPLGEWHKCIFDVPKEVTMVDMSLMKDNEIFEDFLVRVKKEGLGEKRYKSNQLLPRKKDLNNYRVKYLDRDDIESLGYKNNPAFDHKDRFENEEFDIVIYFDSLVENRERGIGITIYDGGANIVFMGYIKNKSELKKIVSMVL